MPRVPIELEGYAGSAVSCVLSSDGGENDMAVVFPGAVRAGNRLGGSPARPDLHYTRAVLQAEGLAVLEVWWDADSAPPDDTWSWVDAHVSAALAFASNEHRLGFLVGRSFGTWALARAVSGEHETPAVPTIWISPLLHDEPVLAALEGLRAPALVVGGRADHLFDIAAAEKLRAAGAQVVLIEGADHALEIDDPAASARLLADAIDAIRAFVVDARRSAR
jgi:pimeloyl-ACP methyl ester carboxylesterase